MESRGKKTFTTGHFLVRQKALTPFHRDMAHCPQVPLSIPFRQCAVLETNPWVKLPKYLALVSLILIKMSLPIKMEENV